VYLDCQSYLYGGKFSPNTGFPHESAKNAPFYGSYTGIGTWAPAGIYYSSTYPRCSDHFISLVLRCVDNKKRITKYVDLFDKWACFFRNNHDPKKGPTNDGLDIKRYPVNLPHWSFVLNSPLAAGANQGIAMHALELCAGIDDTNPENLKILPRAPKPLSGLEIKDFPAIIPNSRTKINYSFNLNPLSFKLKSKKSLPALSVRLGPFTKNEAENYAKKIEIPKDAKTIIDTSGHYNNKTAYWIWIVGMKNLKSVDLFLKNNTRLTFV